MKKIFISGAVLTVIALISYFLIADDGGDGALEGGERLESVAGAVLSNRGNGGVDEDDDDATGVGTVDSMGRLKLGGGKT